MTNKTISKNTAYSLIKESNGKFFTVTFTTKNGEQRTINGRLKPTKTKGSGKNNSKALGYITVYSMQDKGYRNVDTRTISSLSINKTTNKVR